MLLDICSKFARNVKYCSNVAQILKKCLSVFKMQNSATNSKKCSKDAQRNRESPSFNLCKYLDWMDNISLQKARLFVFFLFLLEALFLSSKVPSERVF